MHRSSLALASLALLAGCLPATELLAPRCDLVVETPAPESASPGDVVVVAATPLTSSWDTAVFIGGERATLQSLDRTDCTACDECRQTAECGECGDCDACDLECSVTCSETLTLVVPDGVAPGVAQVEVYNLHGVGETELQVLDTTTGGDSGSTDTSDTGTSDTGTSDTGTSDTGTSDTGGGTGL
ncbi:MAG: hypothetical protein H6742_05450 [Alphaproteobacteria bacterium]|nr:hypothetical protein [Alphaproteobacteria bacterium]